MWPFLAQLIGGPIISGLIGGYKAKLAAGNTSERIAADLAEREIGIQSREAELQTQLRIAQVGHWYEPEHLMGYIATFYLGKLVVWDTMLGLGSTLPLHGWADVTLTAIVAMYFGKRGFENIARILKR